MARKKTLPPEVLEAFREWGRQGARARNRKLTEEQRQEIARKAGMAPKRKRRPIAAPPTPPKRRA